jgi:hypothetical protein
MTFNTKLLIAGLAIGITAYVLFRKSKKHEKEKIAAGQHFQWRPNAQILGAGVAGAAGMAAASAIRPNTGPTPGQEVMWAALRDSNHISDILSACVTDQHLYAFYDFARIHHIAGQIAQSGALYDCCEAWQLPPQLGQDLVKLALFDISFLLDDSLSMQSEGHLRRDALKAILTRAADAGARFDPDGMEVQWMNGQKHGPSRLRSVADAAEIVTKCKWDGRATPLGASLEKMLEANVIPRAESNSLYKPALIIIITDGRPTGQHEHDHKFLRVIRQAKDRLARTRYGPDAISFSICAVGNDREAQEFLDQVDSDPQVGGMVDVTSDRRIEAAQIQKKSGIELTEELHCLKVMLGGIDSSYDTSDEPSGQYRRAAQEKSLEKNRQSREAFETHQYHHHQQEAYRLGLPAPLKPPHVREDQGLNSQGSYAPPPQPSWSQGPHAYEQQGGMPPQSQPYGQPYNQPSSQPYGQSNIQPYGQPFAQPPQSTYGQPPPSQPYGQSSFPNQAPVPPPHDYNNSPYPPSQPSYMPQASTYPSAQPSFPGSNNYAPPPYPNNAMDPSVGGFVMPSPSPASNAYPDQQQQQQQNYQFPSAFPSAYPSS